MQPIGAGKARGAGSFGARPCTTIRRRLFEFGVDSLPPSWRRSWIIARIRATPTWADFRAIKAVYREAQLRTDSTGEPHHVDHIIPLQSPHVCGLHVASNLRVRGAYANMAKGNRWADPNQLDLWESTDCVHCGGFMECGAVPPCDEP